VGITDRKRELFDDILRLRRAERQLPDNVDLVAVRSRLERELGGTVSRSLAAKILGLSHTAVNRWVHSGDVPLVITPTGRSEVPIAALVELYEGVQEQRTSGRRRRHTLEPVLLEGRDRAARLRPQELIAGEASGGGEHRTAELRSLAYHRAVANRLRRSAVDAALHLVWQWRDEGKIDPRYATEWEDVLRRPTDEIKQVIGEDSERGRDLRQNSPFAGALSEPERHRIVSEIR
jgi:hypothetical protein